MLTRPRQRQNGARHIPCSNTERTAKSGDGCLKAGQIDRSGRFPCGSDPSNATCCKPRTLRLLEREAQEPARPGTRRKSILVRSVVFSSDTFILALDGSADHPIRLAGTRVCALFDREIKGEAFLRLWSAREPADRAAV